MHPITVGALRRVDRCRYAPAGPDATLAPCAEKPHGTSPLGGRPGGNGAGRLPGEGAIALGRNGTAHGLGRVATAASHGAICEIDSGRSRWEFVPNRTAEPRLADISPAEHGG